MSITNALSLNTILHKGTWSQDPQKGLGANAHQTLHASNTKHFQQRSYILQHHRERDHHNFKSSLTLHTDISVTTALSSTAWYSIRPPSVRSAPALLTRLSINPPLTSSFASHLRHDQRDVLPQQQYWPDQRYSQAQTFRTWRNRCFFRTKTSTQKAQFPSNHSLSAIRILITTSWRRSAFK